MGTKLQAKAYLPEYNSIINLDGSSSNTLESRYHENQTVKSNQHHEAVAIQKFINGNFGFDMERVKQTILKHESIFKHQLQELHRLYQRQRDLMNETRRIGMLRDKGNSEKSPSSPLLSSIPSEDAKRTWEVSHSWLLESIAGRLSTSCASSKQYSPGFPEGRNADLFSASKVTGISKDCKSFMSNRNVLQQRTFGLECENSSLGGVWKFYCNGDALGSDLSLKRTKDLADLNEPAPVNETTVLSSFGNLGEISWLAKADGSANSSSLKDFSQSSLDGRNVGISLSNPLYMSARHGKEQSSNDLNAVKMKPGELLHSTGGLCPDNSSISIQSGQPGLRNESSTHFSLAESRTESRKKSTIFGIEIPQAKDDAAVMLSKSSSVTPWTTTSNSLENKVKPLEENHCGVPSELPHWIAKSSIRSTELNSENDSDYARANHVQNCSVRMNGHFSSTGDFKPYEKNSLTERLRGSDGNMSRHGTFLCTEKLIHQENSALGHSHSKQESGIPWFLREPKYGSEGAKDGGNSYFMNLDSLQNYSQQFFKKDEKVYGSSITLEQKLEQAPGMISQDTGSSKVDGTNGTNSKKIMGFPIPDLLSIPKEKASGISCTDGSSSREVSDKAHPSVEAKDFGSRDNCFSGLRHIDLNLSLDEEEALEAPFLPTAVLKIATTEIDLEAPAVIDSEVDEAPKEVCSTEMEISLEKFKPEDESEKYAAEAIIAMSLSGVNNVLKDGDNQPQETASYDRLKWFAEIISSEGSENESTGDTISLSPTGACNEESVPDGMDYFEFMTLKLKDSKEEDYYYKLPTFGNQDDEETAANTLLKRPRRGQPRKGRQRKDFQRDILPGLVSLSRHEVTEDLHTIEELFKAVGCSWQSSLSHRNSGRNGRGRRRSGGTTLSPTKKAVCSSPKQQSVCLEQGLEEQKLTGWGKRTRRLPRQRAPNGNIAIPLKC